MNRYINPWRHNEIESFCRFPIANQITLWASDNIDNLLGSLDEIDQLLIVTRRGDLAILDYYRAENYLLNDIKYVRIRLILTKLQTSEHITVKTHRNKEMACYLLFINIYGKDD